MSRIFWILGRNKRETTPSCSIILPSTLRTNLRTSTYFETEWKKKGKEKGRGKKERGSDLYLHYLTSRPFFFPLLFSPLLSRSFSRRKNLSPPSVLLPSLLPSLCGGFTGRTNRRTTQSPQTGGTVCFYVHVKVSTYLPTYLRST